MVDYKVKTTPLTQFKADHDFQPAVYLAGRWLGRPSAEFSFGQIAKPGPRRKEISASIVTTGRSTGQLRGALARIAQAARQIVALLRPLRIRRAMGIRRARLMEVQLPLLRGVGQLPGRGGAVGAERS